LKNYDVHAYLWANAYWAAKQNCDYSDKKIIGIKTTTKYERSIHCCTYSKVNARHVR
jgi:hypothetical protein